DASRRAKELRLRVWGKPALVWKVGGAPFMPITPYLAHQAFEPETIQTMSAAFVAACDALHLKVGDDPATRVVAEKVVNLAQRGIRDPDMLRTMTLKELDLSDDRLRDN